MFSRFFIQRPIFSSVISIIIVCAGVVALRFLPIELYPDIAPPMVSVSAVYPGADAQTVADTVAAPIEEELNGVEGMLYMTSHNASSGLMSLGIVFDVGTDVNQARIDVQNKVDVAVPRLPDDVRREGIVVGKSSPSFILVAAVESPSGKYDPIFVSNYASLVVADELKRVKGVLSANVIGARDYSMRIWLKTDQMTEIGLTTADIVKAIQAQNVEYPIGEIGGAPTAGYVELTVPITTRGRLNDPKEYENIILRANKNGGVLRLKDVATVELGAVDYSVVGELNGVPTALISIYQQYGANALQVAHDVKKTLERVSKKFPVGIEYSIPYDVTKFVKASIKEVILTVVEATLLVALVVFLFLQNWRVAVIPMIAMVVSIVGTFGGMYLMGFSMNTLTLFGLVMAMGIVVDDAIVVVENVERNMREGKMHAKEAAYKAMKEVTGPVIAIVFVLCAVFIPVAFMGGIAGELYKQFAFTITISVIISGLVALTLSPALAAILLTHSHTEKEYSKRFHRIFGKFTSTYLRGADWIVKNRIISIFIFVLLLGFIALAYHFVPRSFVPQEDQGYFIGVAALPDAASLQRTQAVTKKVTEITLKNPAVESIFTMSGMSMLEGTNRSNASSFFPILKDWKIRKGKHQGVKEVIATLSKEYAQIPEANVMAFNPPAIRGLGGLGGFEAWIVNRSDAPMAALEQVTKDVIAATKKRKELAGVSSQINADSLQFTVELDRAKTIAYEVAIGDVFAALQSVYGSYYVNDFNKFGRVFRVMLQSGPEYRNSIDDMARIYVRSAKGEMIPLTSLLNVKFSKAPTLVNRYNGFPAAQLNGNPAPGHSSGDAMNALEEVAYEILPEGMSIAWSGQAYQEKKTGNTSNFVLLGGMLMVFFILSALYERWSLPIAILLAVPFGILGAFLAIWIRGINNDIYFQIGLVALIGLAAKNAILIVEFANIKRREGMGIEESALEAARLRFRAIMMTSLTFIVGVMPLVFSSGAGSESRHSVGTGVMGGMILATFFGIFFIPLFYVLFHGKGDKNEKI